MADRPDEKRLAHDLRIEREYTPSRKAMKAALRVVLGWPPVLEGSDDDGPDDHDEDLGSCLLEG